MHLDGCCTASLCSVARVPAWAGVGSTPNSHMYTQLVSCFNVSRVACVQAVLVCVRVVWLKFALACFVCVIALFLLPARSGKGLVPLGMSDQCKSSCASFAS